MYVQDFDCLLPLIAGCVNSNISISINNYFYWCRQFVITGWLLCLCKVVCISIKTLDCEFTGSL